MPRPPIQATIDAFHAALVDLGHIAASDELTQLKRILLLRIAELESLRDSAPAPPLNDHR